MKKLATLLVLALAPVLATLAGSSKLVYTHDQLEKEGDNNIPGIVDRYLADTGRTTLVSPDKFLLLLNGTPAADAARHLGTSDRVEVLTNGDALVINVVTVASKPGA